MESSYTSASTKPLFRGAQIVWYLLDILEVLLVFRFALKLLGANPVAGFTEFIYGTTNIFVAPFINVFHVVSIEGSVFEWTTLLAMLVYWIVAWALISLFLISKTVSTPEAAKKLEDKKF